MKELAGGECPLQQGGDQPMRISWDQVLGSFRSNCKPNKGLGMLRCTGRILIRLHLKKSIRVQGKHTQNFVGCACLHCSRD